MYLKLNSIARPTPDANMLLCGVVSASGRERTVAPRRAGTKGKGSIRPLCSGGGAIAHNNSVYATHPFV